MDKAGSEDTEEFVRALDESVQDRRQAFGVWQNDIIKSDISRRCRCPR